MPGCTEKPQSQASGRAGSQAHASARGMRNASRERAGGGKDAASALALPAGTGSRALASAALRCSALLYLSCAASVCTGSQLPAGHRTHTSRRSAPQHRAAAPEPCLPAEYCCGLLPTHSLSSLPLHSISCLFSHCVPCAAPPGRGCMLSDDAQTAALQGDGSGVDPGAHAGSGCQARARLARQACLAPPTLASWICRGGPTDCAESSTAWRGAVLREMRGLHEGQP